MDKDVLARWIEEGLSQSEIGRRAGRHPSTIAYWCAKYGLTPVDVGHGPRGAISRERYEELVARDLTVREIATVLDRSAATVKHWLRRYGLQTTMGARQQARRKVAPLERFVARCRQHGETAFVRSANGTSACLRCRAEDVSEWRRRAKRRLVAMAGGRCAVCGYDRCVAALQFHHRDPATKEFGLGSRGLARAWDTLVAEADKCVLLCANCHAEVEAGVATLP